MAGFNSPNLHWRKPPPDPPAPPGGFYTTLDRSSQRGFNHINPAIYAPMQGPSELGMSPNASLARWDRVSDLGRITVPTLVIGAEHDTMDPHHLREMARRLPQGRYHHCPNGSHLAMYDDQEVYFSGLLAFLSDLDRAASGH